MVKSLKKIFLSNLFLIFLHTIIQYQAFVSNMNDLQTDLFDQKIRL